MAVWHICFRWRLWPIAAKTTFDLSIVAVRIYFSNHKTMKLHAYHISTLRRCRFLKRYPWKTSTYVTYIWTIAWLCSRSIPYTTPFYSWWRHQMETFSASLAICAGNSPVTGEFPSQRPVLRSLRLNKRFSKEWWGWWFETQSFSLWRHCNGRIERLYMTVDDFATQWATTVFI